MSTHHQIPPEPENMVWGYFDPALEPILTVASGDTVGLTSWAASTPATLPADRSLVNPKHLQAMEQLTQGPSSHFMVGPIAVDGAEIGQVLQIDILETTLADDWGYTAVRPLAGTLPYEFEETHIAHSLKAEATEPSRMSPDGLQPWAGGRSSSSSVPRLLTRRWPPLGAMAATPGVTGCPASASITVKPDTLASHWTRVGVNPSVMC